MQCHKCGTDNPIENKFCISCGKPLLNSKLNSDWRTFTRRNDSKKNDTIQKNSIQQYVKSKKSMANMSVGLKPLLIAVGVITVSLLIVLAFDLFLWEGISRRPPKETRSDNPLVEAEVFNIASKFICACGKCNEKSLEVCKCGRAVEERQFIRDYAEKNKKKEEIVTALNSKYGFLKTQFAEESKLIDSSKIYEKDQKTLPAANLKKNNIELNKMANLSDKTTIYSAFKCNCGKCGIDELKECDCSLPKGAQEVKKFIDKKISANKYTVQDIIELVNSKYGEKKHKVN